MITMLQQCEVRFSDCFRDPPRNEGLPSFGCLGNGGGGEREGERGNEVMVSEVISDEEALSGSAWNLEPKAGRR